MFRLAELYYEKANDDFRLATEQFREEARRAAPRGASRRPEPMKSYAPSIALYQRLLTGFPDYKFTHGIYYLLAYCLGEMGQGQEAQVAYQALIEQFPDSPFVPEAWVRLGDWHFDEVAADSLPQAAEAFSKMYAYPDHPLYARAVYKLGWTYYRMDDYADAVEAFTRLLDFYVAKAAKAGEKPGGDVWPEAVQYTAISFADEKWGGVEKARAFFAARGGRPYEAEVFTRLGDVFFEETRFADAVEAYKVVLARDPLSPDAPRIQGRIVLAWSRDRRFDQEAGRAAGAGRRLLRGDALVAAEQGRSGPGRLGARPDREEPDARRRLPPRPGPAAQGRGEARGRGGGVPAWPPGPTATTWRASRTPSRPTSSPTTTPTASTTRSDFEKAARTYAAVRDDPADDKYLVRGGALGGDLLGGRGDAAAAGRPAAGPEGAALHRPQGEGARSSRCRCPRSTRTWCATRTSSWPGAATPPRPPPWPSRPARSSTGTTTSTRPAAASRRWWGAGPPTRWRSSPPT